MPLRYPLLTCRLVADQLAALQLPDARKERPDVVLRHRLRQVVDDEVGLAGVVAPSTPQQGRHHHTPSVLLEGRRVHHRTRFGVYCRYLRHTQARGVSGEVKRKVNGKVSWKVNSRVNCKVRGTCIVTPALDRHWTSTGPALDRHWTSTGPALDRHWTTSTGPALDHQHWIGSVEL